jgi:hypothetical protein
MKNLLDKHPDTSHVLMVDDYYLEQSREILKLVDEYAAYCEWSQTTDTVLGASTWIRVRDRSFTTKTRFYDETTPEAYNPHGEKYSPRSIGLIPVAAVGACYIFPIHAWKKNGYQCNPYTFQPEHVSLCRGFRTLLDLNVKLWRHDRTDAIYPLTKVLRVKLGAWRRRL